MALLLLIAFIVVPLVELYVIIQVGQAIGVVPTIFLLLLSAVLGTALLRSQGRVVWRRFNDALAERRVPHREVFDGVLVILGGALLLTPGFVTDIFGMLFLIPPSRAAIRGLASRLLVGRVMLGGRTAAWGYGRMRGRRSGTGPAAGAGAGAGGAPPGGTGRAGPPPRRSRSSYDVDGTAHEIKDETLLDRPAPEPER
jgi:UPF0716 protein FxsA